MTSFDENGSPKEGRPVLRSPGGKRLRTSSAFKNIHGRAPRIKPAGKPAFRDVIGGANHIMDSFIDGGE